MEWVDSLEFYSGIFSDRKLKAYIFKKILNWGVINVVFVTVFLSILLKYWIDIELYQGQSVLNLLNYEYVICLEHTFYYNYKL